MLGDIVPYLSCPVCGRDLASAGSSLRCKQNHSFDVARQGYVNLLPGGAHTGSADSPAMILAREEIYGSELFAPLRQAIIDTAASEISEDTQGCIADFGAGPGYYLSGILERLPKCVGLAADISKFAVRKAARAHNNIGAIVCDIWSKLPIRDKSVLLILNVFAPRSPSEFRRILKSDGRLITIVPTQNHLRELISALGLLKVDEYKQERLEQQLEFDFAQRRVLRYEATLPLSRSNMLSLVGMGPSARHIKPEVLQKQVAALTEPQGVTISTDIVTYTPQVL